jgi:hypothetical protein
MTCILLPGELLLHTWLLELAAQLSRSAVGAGRKNQISLPPGGPDVDIVAHRLRILAEAGVERTPNTVGM